MLAEYLKTLINLDILEREVPVTEENPEKSKKGLYKIKDNFILFWFRFVFPNLNYIESGHVQLAMQRFGQIWQMRIFPMFMKTSAWKKCGN